MSTELMIPSNPLILSCMIYLRAHTHTHTHIYTHPGKTSCALQKHNPRQKLKLKEIHMHKSSNTFSRWPRLGVSGDTVGAIHQFPSGPCHLRSRILTLLLSSLIVFLLNLMPWRGLSSAGFGCGVALPPSGLPLTLGPAAAC